MAKADRDELLAFYDFPAAHWTHLRTTNVIESAFATLRHRSSRAKGCVTRQTMLSMIYKVGRCAEKSWRRVRGFRQLAKVIEGVTFNDGIELIEDSRALGRSDTERESPARGSGLAHAGPDLRRRIQLRRACGRRRHKKADAVPESTPSCQRLSATDGVSILSPSRASARSASRMSHTRDGGLRFREVAVIARDSVEGHSVSHCLELLSKGRSGWRGLGRKPPSPMLWCGGARFGYIANIN